MIKRKIQTTLAGGALVIAVAMGTVATATPAMASSTSASGAAVAINHSSVATSTVLAVPESKTVPALGIRPTQDLMQCWAQVGRVVGGFYGALIATAAGPFAAAAAWAVYLGTLSQEKRDEMGNLAC